MNFLRIHKTESIIFTAVVLFLSGWFVLFYFLDRSFGDIDGNPDYSFPIYGQDAPRYVLLANNIVDKHIFSIDGKTPEVFRTPGYPLLLAFSKIISGNFILASFINILFAAGLAILVYYLGRPIVPNSLAIAAAVIFSVSPNTIFHSIGSYGEIPFTFFLLLGVYLAFLREGINKKTYLLAGICIGIAALIRPIALYYGPLLMAFILWKNYRAGGLKNAPTLLLLFAIGTLVIVSPWVLRNRIVGGSFSMSSIGAYNLAQYNTALFLESKFGPESPESLSYREKLNNIPDEEGKSFAEEGVLIELSNKELDGHRLSYLLFHAVESSKFFLSSSLRYAVIHVQIPGVQNWFGLNQSSPDLLSLLRSFNVVKIIDTLKAQSFLTIDRILMFAVTLFALLSVFFKRSRFYAVLFICSALYFATLTGPVSIPRYRLPMDPFLIILTLYSLNWLYDLFCLKSVRPEMP